MGIRKDSPYKAVFQKASKKFVESGQLQILLKRFNPDDSQCSPMDSGDAPAISLEKIFTLFFAYFLGSIVLPMILLNFERLFFKSDKVLDEDRIEKSAISNDSGKLGEA